ncbi:MAG: DUF4062 domain-containing protein [Planctomycetota bacterium]
MKVFISSVIEGLEDVRKDLANGLAKSGHQPIMQEHFGSRPNPPLEECLAAVRESDAVVLLFGTRYGSRVPNSTLSYTHSEFQAARAIKRPVFVCVIADAPPPSKGDEVPVAEFRREVGASCVWDSVPLADVVKSCLASVAGYLTRSQTPRFFQILTDHFAPYLDSTNVFNHSLALFGREEQTQEVEMAILGGRRAILIEGAGGVGKSRLLLEVAKRIEVKLGAQTVRLVSSGAQWTREHLRELPGGKVVIVFDDAHHRDDLEEVIAAVLGVRPDCAFILSTRPLGMQQVLAQLRVVEDGKLSHAVRLGPLSNPADQLLLAKAALGKAAAGFADQLVAASDGVPLIVTVGGACLARGLLPPNLLAEDPSAFRSAALDRIISDDVRAGISQSLNTDALLGTLAAVAPFRPEDKVHVDLLATFLKVGAPELVQTLGNLERAGLFLRRGRLVRILPDVLADHLVLKSALNRMDKPTGIVDLWLEAFRKTFFGNLLENLGNLEYRLRFRTHAQVDNVLLAEFWKSTFNQIPRMTNIARWELLTELQKVAIFQPEAILQILEIVTHGPRAPRDASAHMWGVKDDPLRALDRAPALLSLVLLHPQHAAIAATRLCELIQLLGVKSGTPDTVLDALRKAVQYDHRFLFRTEDALTISAATLDAVATFARTRMTEPDDLDWLFDVLKEALKREISQVTSTASNLTIRPWSMAKLADKLGAHRALALDLLAELVSKGDATNAKLALTTLTGLLYQPETSFVRRVDKEELDAWFPEVVDVLKRLVSIASRTPNAALRFAIKYRLLNHEEAGWPDALEAIHAAAEAVPAGPDHALFQFVARKSWMPRTPEALAVELAGLKQALSTLEEAAGSIEAVVEHLNVVLSELCKYLDITRGALQDTLTALGRSEVGRTVQMLKAITSRRLRLLYSGITQSLVDLRSTSPEAFKSALTVLCADRSREIRREAAESIRWMSKPGDHDLVRYEAVERLCRDRDLNVRVAALHALSRLAKGHPAESIPLVMSLSGRTEEEVDGQLSVFHDTLGIRYSELKKSQVDKLLARLENLPGISHQSLHIFLFLKAAKSIRPARTVRLFLSRISKGAQKCEAAGNKAFEPLPSDAVAMLDLGEDALRPEVTRSLVGALLLMKKRSWRYSQWVPQLINSVAPEFSNLKPTLEAFLRESSSHIKMVAKVVAGQGHDVIYDAHDLVADIIHRAYKLLPDEERKAVMSYLYSAASSSGWNSSFGEPPPRWVKDKERATKLAQEYEADHRVRNFYEELRASAQRMIDDSLADDAELDF